MNKLVILGTNYFIVELAKIAKQLGYETHMFGKSVASKVTLRRPEGLLRHLDLAAVKYVDYFYPISILDKNDILQVCKYIKPSGVVSIATDTAVPTVSYLAHHLGLTGNSEHCATICTDKIAMKKHFLENGIPTSKYQTVKSYLEVKDLKYPLIVKASDRSGKLGITKVNKPRRLSSAVEYAMDASYEDEVIVEEYLEGPEWTVESISWQGKHHVLTFTEKFSDPPHFVEEVHLQPAPLDRETLVPQVHKILDAMEIKNGPSHIEFKLIDGKITVIEIAARVVADDIWRVMELTTGFNWIKGAIDIACGKEPDLSTYKPNDTFACVKFILNQADYDRYDDTVKNHPDKISAISYSMDACDGDVVVNNTDRYGHYVLQCNSKQELLKLIGRE